jgi:hypothetical protein
MAKRRKTGIRRKKVPLAQKQKLPLPTRRLPIPRIEETDYFEDEDAEYGGAFDSPTRVR